MISEIARDAGKLQRALDHAERRVAVAVHDAVAQRTVIRADPHCAAMLLAKLHQRRKPFADALQFRCVVGVGVFLYRELFRIGVVAGIHADFLHPLRRLHRGLGLEVNISDNRHPASARAESGDDVLQIRRVLHGRRGDANDLAADVCEVDRLLDGCGGIHRVACDHALDANRIIATYGDITDADHARLPPLAVKKRRAEFHGARQ